MVDVIQVPAAPATPELFVLVGLSLVMNTALSMLTVWLTKKQQRTEKPSEDKTKDILMLLALTSGRYDMLKRLLAYEAVAGKGKIPENVAQIMGMMRDDKVPKDIKKVGKLEPKDLIGQSTEMIKDDVLVDVSDKLRESLRQKLELEIKKNLYKKYKIKL